MPWTAPCMASSRVMGRSNTNGGAPAASALRRRRLLLALLGGSSAARVSVMSSLCLHGAWVALADITKDLPFSTGHITSTRINKDTSEVP